MALFGLDFGAWSWSFFKNLCDSLSLTQKRGLADGCWSLLWGFVTGNVCQRPFGVLASGDLACREPFIEKSNKASDRQKSRSKSKLMIVSSNSELRAERLSHITWREVTSHPAGTQLE